MIKIILPEYVVHPPQLLPNPSYRGEKQVHEIVRSFSNVTPPSASALDVDVTLKLYRDHWKKLHTIIPSKDGLAVWVKDIPNIFCECGTKLSQILLDLPPVGRFVDEKKNEYDEFAWTVTVHNAVNASLVGKKQIQLEEAIQIWRPDLLPSQPKINNLLLVTSLSPLPSHQEQQAIALESWKRFGLNVVSVNLPEEIRTLEEKYDIEFIETTESCNQFNRKLPTINSLANVSIVRDTPIMLLNSDCALYGSQKLVLDVKHVGIGIRHNWSEHLSDATQEQWGLDAFILQPEHARSLPRLPFGIGQPMWDYWVAWHMQQAGFQVDWIGGKLIYHKSHPTNWTPEDCQVGRNWITEYYETSIDWVKWREQQPHTFSIFSPVRK